MEKDQAPSPGHGKGSFQNWVPPAVMALVILFFSSIPGTALPDHPDRLNNVVHFLEFALLGFFVAKAISTRRPTAPSGLILATLVLCGTFGFLDEAHQFLIPYRMFDVMDLFFDTLGAFTGSFFFVVAWPSLLSGAGD